MADTRCQSECEAWVRQWLAEKFGQSFSEPNVPLNTGGNFKFDAVSDDGSILVSISTSQALMSSGKRGVGKLMKLRGDMLFHTLVSVPHKIMAFTEPCMHQACLAPTDIEFIYIPLPVELAAKLSLSRDCSSREVRPVIQPVA
jgi:hypothetical protein